MNLFLEDNWDSPCHMFLDYDEWNKKIKRNILIMQYTERVKEKMEHHPNCKLLKYGYRYLTTNPEVIPIERTNQIVHGTRLKLQFIDSFFYGFYYSSEDVDNEIRKWDDMNKKFYLVYFEKSCNDSDSLFFKDLFGDVCYILIERSNIFEIL